jgi:anti-sigma regulatory factor (Ser/Thr protein kinase)/serine/threonine protein phosphatase PrpC
MAVTTTEAFELEHDADIGAVRRRLAVLAAEAGLDEGRAGDAALIVNELATNVLRHAHHGGMLIACVGEDSRRGVSMAAWDRGPGMDVDACLRDGMSTAGTAGVGLGAVARLATRWDAYAPRGKGTVITATVFPHGDIRPAAFDVGGLCVPYPGMATCGDAWDALVHGDRATVIVCDGLGHGEGAAEASRAVIAAFRHGPDDLPAGILERAHRAARSTRGAAALVVRVDRAAREATIAAVGNVAAWIVSDAQRQLVTQHGTLGHASPPIREERYAFPPGALLIMCTDGLKTRVPLDEHPGLIARHPATIATVLWRDHGRERDDATAVALREVR